MEKFSVLMSVYYKENPSFLKQALESVWWQTAKPSEIVVVKDGPLTPELDSTLATLAAVMPIKMVPLSKNNGLGKALSIGLQTCSNELIARMDSDDIAKPNRFERELAVFETNPEIDVVGSWVDEFQDTVDHIIGVRKVPEWQGNIINYAKYRSPVNHPSVMYRKSSVLATGNYQHMNQYEDYYLWIRMLMRGCVFYNIQESLLFFRTSSNLYRRRGGLKYVRYDVAFQKAIVKIGYQTRLLALINMMIRIPIRLLPNRLRGLFYRMLRS